VWLAGPRGSSGPPASVFEQVHPPWATGFAALRSRASDRLPDNGWWDLYAGIGETTALLVEAGAQVESVRAGRSSGRACRIDRVSALRHAGLAETIVRRLAKLMLVVTNLPDRYGPDRDCRGRRERRRTRGVRSCDRQPWLVNRLPWPLDLP
jgi:hypothetical protein